MKKQSFPVSPLDGASTTAILPGITFFNVYANTAPRRLRKRSNPCPLPCLVGRTPSAKYFVRALYGCTVTATMTKASAIAKHVSPSRSPHIFQARKVQPWFPEKVGRCVSRTSIGFRACSTHTHIRCRVNYSRPCLPSRPS